MGTITRRGVWTPFLAIALLIVPGGLRAQEEEQETNTRIVPTNNFVVTGYGTVGYVARTTGDNINSFTAGFNPIFLFQFQDRILFQAEFEFELADGITETGLEYAQLDYMAADNLTLTGGKFLIPFGVFAERLHPTWINKFPTAPPLWGHHVSEFGVEPLIPILSDIGVMARATATPGPWQLSVNGYVTQGPSAEGEIHEPDHDDFEPPEFGFPASSSDNNSGKMPGFRVDIALPPWFEVNGSFLNGDYDDQGVLDFTGWNAAAEFRHRGLEVRGEYIQVRQEVEELDGFQTLRRHGFYAQTSYRVGHWEPVLRWTQIFDDRLEGEVVTQGAWQAGIGLDYWFTPSVALMGGYEVNREDGEELDNDRVIIHLAFGF